MESIRGTHTFTIDADNLKARTMGYHGIIMDIGTGDGRYVRHLARTCPEWFAIGIDACRENLRATSRTAPDNALFVIANALTLPTELHGHATRIVVNFPWGSLLEGLLMADQSVADGLIALARPQATLEIRLNARALDAAEWTAEEGVRRLRAVLADRGFAIGPTRCMDKDALRALPSTWGKRLAYGRDPQAWCLTATCPTQERRPMVHTNSSLALRAETPPSSGE